MPLNRPSIPAETKRQVLIEAGHRCSACGTELPLELAHISPWSRSRDHSASNLICLCANCHSRADKEKWGEETLRQYKKRPHIHRYRTEEPSSRSVSLSALHQLPPWPADFIGREVDLRDLLVAAETRHPNAVILRGMPGIGKTALALRLACELAPQYPDAQLYLDLQGVSPTPLTPFQAMAHVIRSFQPEARIPETQTEITSLFRSILYGRRALLLMDNAADRDQVEALALPEGNLLLITSRHHFHLPGSYAHNILELSPDDSRELLLRLEPRIKKQADQIAHVCSGIPFALHQAAGTLSTRPDLSPARYAQRLASEKERLGLIDASLNLSYNLLPEALAQKWRYLAVFPLDFTPPAARSVWDVDDEETENAIGELVRRSLLQGQEERYRLHDLARLFAGSLLKPEERQIAEVSHSSFYLLVAAESAQTFMDGRELEGLEAFDAEWINIRAGFKYASRASTSSETAAHLTTYYPSACQPFTSLRIQSNESLDWLATALPTARRLKNPLYTATILNQLGLVLRHLGRHREAAQSFRDALAEISGLDNIEAEGITIGNLAHELLFLGEANQARPALERALSISRLLGDRHGETLALSGLERLHFALRNFPQALDFAKQWLDASRQAGQRHSEGQALGNMGVTYGQMGEYQKAIECFLADLTIACEVGDLPGQAACIGNLGWMSACIGETDEAIQLLEQRIALSRSIDDPRGEAESSWILADLYEERGNLERVLELRQATANYKRSIRHPDADEIQGEVEALRARLASTEAESA